MVFGHLEEFYQQEDTTPETPKTEAKGGLEFWGYLVLLVQQGIGHIHCAKIAKDLKQI